MSPRASFDDFLDDAELPDEILPSEKQNLPMPRGPARARGPASQLPRLPSLKALAAQMPPSRSMATPSAQKSTQGLGASTASRQARPLPISAALPPEQTSGMSATPQRNRPAQSANNLGLTPPPLVHRANSQKHSHAPPELERHVGKPQKPVRVSAPAHAQPALIEAVDDAALGSCIRERTHAGTDCQQLTSCLEIVPSGAVPARSRSSALQPTSLELVPYEPDARAIVPFKPARKKARKNDAALDELRGRDLVEVPIAVFTTGGGGLRATRPRIPMLESWRGEYVVYNNSAGCTAKAVVINRSGARLSRLALSDSALLAIEDCKPLFAIEDQQRCPALKDQSQPRRRKPIEDKNRCPTQPDKSKPRRRKRRLEDDE